MRDPLDRRRERAEARRRGSYLGDRVGKSLCFVQGDQSIANQAGAAFRSDLNNELQALVTNSQGNAAPGTTYRNQTWHDSTANVKKRRNAANSGWIVEGTLDESFILSRASNTILGLSDIGKTIIATAGFTQTLTAAATLGDGWSCYFINTHATAACTIDPNASEQINGASTIIVPPGCGGMIVCNGSAFRMTIAPQFDSSGNLIFAADNAYDIGASGATRPRDLFLGRNASIAGYANAIGGSFSTNGHTGSLAQNTNSGTIVSAANYQNYLMWGSADATTTIYGAALVFFDGAGGGHVTALASGGITFTTGTNTIFVQHNNPSAQGIYWGSLRLKGNND